MDRRLQEFWTFLYWLGVCGAIWVAVMGICIGLIRWWITAAVSP